MFKWLMTLIFVLFFTIPSFAAAVNTQQDGVGLGSVVTLNCSTGMTCTKTGNRLDMTSSGGGGSYTDTQARSATGWTDSGTSVYTTTSTDNVGIGTTLPISSLSIASSKINFVGCSDSLATAITNAPAGSTLQLGACNYSLGTVTNNKALNILGVKDGSTTITLTGMFTQTADNFSLKNTKVVTTNGSYFELDCRGGTSCTNISFIDDILAMENTAGTVHGVFYRDAGGYINNVICTSTDHAPTNGAADFASCFFKQNSPTQEINTTLLITNSTATCLTESGSGNTTGTFTKCIENWTDVSVSTPPNIGAMNLYNVHSKGTNQAGASNARGLVVEGPNNNVNVYGGSLEGTYDISGDVDILISNTGGSPTTKLYGTTLVSGVISDTSNTILNYGQYQGNSINLKDMGIPPSLNGATSIAAQPLISAVGGVGGTTTIATTGTGGTGSAVTITAGIGGVANSSNTASTGGIGGAITTTAGVGGASTVATGVNVGGAGGAYTITSGAGGNASGGTSNTGGASGNLTLGTGIVGTGATAAGTLGSISLKEGTTTVAKFNPLDANGYLNVGIGTASPSASLEIANISNGSGIFLRGGSVTSSLGINFDQSLKNGAGQANYAIKHGYNGNGFEILRSTSPTASPGTSTFFINPSGDVSLGGNTAFTNPALSAMQGGNVGIGTINPRNKLSVVGNASIGDATYANTIAPTNGLLIKGNVGIGTVNPRGPLDVGTGLIYGDGSQLINLPASGSAGFTDGGTNVYLTTTTDTVGIGTTTPNATTLEIVKQGSTVPLKISGSASGNGNLFIVTSAGNVGIGTTTAPANALVVNGTIQTVSTSAGSVQLTEASANGANTVTISAPSSLTGDRTCTLEDDSTPFDSCVTASGGASGWTDGGTNVYTTATTDNVGIGTTTPTANLEVVTHTVAPLMISSTATGDGNQLIVLSGGNVGIGTTAPVGGFVVMNGNVGIGTWSPTGKLQVGGTGNVGIGTLNPQNTLQVNGTFQVDNASGIGWTWINGADNTACNTICTSGCVMGFLNATGTAITQGTTCSDATADECLCAGPS